MGAVFFQFFNVKQVSALSPTSPIYTVYRDTTWLESITSTTQPLSWDTEISENGGIPADGTHTSFNLSDGWHYLLMYSVPVRSSAWTNRSEVQSWIQINWSTDSEYGYSSSYIRRTNNDFEWYNESAAVLDVSAGDDISINIQKTDSNSATVERTPGRSGINILKLDDDWEYARLRPSVSQAITTSWTDVDLGTVDELDASGFSVSWNDVTLSSVGKYLVTYNVWAITTGTDRTNNEMRLTLDGLEIEATRSNTYIRAQNGSYTGISSFVGIIETTSMTQVLNMEIMRTSTMQGTTNDTVIWKTWLTITKLPDNADYVRMSELGGGQDITTSANTPMTFDTTLEQWDSLVHSSVTKSEIDVISSGDYMLFHSIYNNRTDTSNGPRENPYLEWQVSWSTVEYWVSWSYNRNANDGDGISNSSHSSAWIILPSLTTGDTIELTETNEATAGSSTYSAWYMWIQWVDLASLFSTTAYLSQLSYRWRDDNSDFDVDAGWLASENTNISNVSKDETLRLRMKVENTSWYTYNTDSRFEIQWAETSSTCLSSLSWTSISDANDDWEMVDTSHISPNAETSSTQLLANISGNTHLQSEWYHNEDGESSVTLANIFVDNSQKEYEFSINATAYTQDNNIYCFRLYDISSADTLWINNYAKLQMWSTAVVLADVWGEAGSVLSELDGAWSTITFDGGPYTTPVIVWRTNTYNDGNEALVFEAKNVTSTTAEIRLCDSQASNAIGCDSHAVETIWYIVVDVSQVSSVDGIDAGIFSADESFDTAGWSITTSYSETFSNTPYVFTSVQSTNGNGPVVTRVSSSSISDFTGGICQQNSQDGCNATHVAETFGWIAVDPTMNPFMIDMDIGSGASNATSSIWTSASFSTSFDTIPIAVSQTITNNGWQDVQVDEIQNITLTGMDYRACELDDDDDCDGHNSDTLVWLALEEWVFASEYYLNETYYRWYENNGLITPDTALADENTTLSSLPVSEEIRLRMLIQNSEINLPSSVLNLQLQYWSGVSCDSIVTWTNVWASWGWEDWLHYDNVWVTDGDTLTSSLLFWWSHNLQSYSESLPTVSNPNAIPAWEWGEWDFSLIKNAGATWDEYCFRVVTQTDDEIEYSSYAMINTSDSIDPVINSYTPGSWSLLPVWNFEITYLYSDADSGIDITNVDFILQKWDGVLWWSDISGLNSSLNLLTVSSATYDVAGLIYGKYRGAFEIYDIAGNSSYVIHEFYVDEIEFTVSRSEVDIWTIAQSWIQYDSADEIIITVSTVWAWFDVSMVESSILNEWSEDLLSWDGSEWYGYDQSPYSWTITNYSSSTQVIWSELKNPHPDGDKYTYTYTLKYSALLWDLNDFISGDYEGGVDFQINLSYN